MTDLVRIDAPMREEYRDARGLVVATLTFRRRIPVLDAVAWVKDRLGDAGQDRDWSRVTAREAEGRRYAVTVYVPPLGVPVASPEDADETESEASVRRALVAAVQGRADAMMALVEPATALPVELGAALAEYARDAARAEVFGVYALRELFDRGGRLIDALVHRATTQTDTAPRHIGGLS